MDNKITKSKVSNFFAYEWIILIVVVLASVLVWELVYTMTAVRLTTGQHFKYYYDESVYSININSLYNTLVDEKTFSYDVLDVGVESLTSDYNVLATRLTVQEGDAIITDAVPQGEGDIKVKRADGLIDSYRMFSFEDLTDRARNYLFSFMKDSVKNGRKFSEIANDEFVYQNLDEEKIAQNFLKRMKKDNRYRKDEAKQQGIQAEKQRIQKLCDEVVFLQTQLDTHPEYFYRYTMYSQMVNICEEDEKAGYQELLAQETEKSYGLNAEALVPASGNSKLKNTDYFRVRNSEYAEKGSKDVVILIFDFEAYQKDLQFETISFLNTIIRTFTVAV